MAKKIVLVLLVLAIASFVSAQEPEQAPSGVTGICLFEDGIVYCPEINTPETIAPRQAWETLGNVDALPAHIQQFVCIRDGYSGNDPK